MTRYPQTILGTCCVPWNEDGSLAEEIFRDSIRHLIDNGISDLYIFGTAGEGYAVNETQFDEVTRIFCEEMTARGAAPMVGLISQSLSTIISRIERAAEMGARAFQISLPSWGTLNEREVQTFFRETCGRFPQYRFLHYNLMRAGRLVTPLEYSRLAGEHPNLVATKHGTADINIISGLLSKAPELRHFITEGGFAYGSMIGEVGFLVSVASVNPHRAREYFEAGVQRDAEKLFTMQRELTGIVAELLQTVGSTAHMDGAYDKIFARLHDKRFPLRLLPPYEGTTEEVFAKFVEVLRERYPGWVIE